jgi:pyruvate,orthophosphate dikinase
MFLGDRLPIVQRFILAADDAEERAALEELAKLQRSDFESIFEAMDGLPVTIRLLDPPLHEFLPDIEELLVQDALGKLDDEGRVLLAAAQQWREANPMLGTRGVRLGILKPGLYRMQAKAILEAALARKHAGGDPHVEIMIPLIVSEPELELVTAWVREVAAETFAASDDGAVDYLVGTMVETPRAAIAAGEVAEVAEFFSFGTNDLTQMTFGFSRDDVEGRFMTEYLELKLLPANPFETLDQEGVGELVRMAVERGRATRPDLHLGICGEHGGDPASVAFFASVGLDYVSCSPYRVPIARLAAAHAALGAAGPGSTA